MLCLSIDRRAILHLDLQEPRITVCHQVEWCVLRERQKKTTAPLGKIELGMQNPEIALVLRVMPSHDGAPNPAI